MYKMELNQTDQDCFYNFLEEYPELADDIYMFNTHSGRLAVGLESFELSQFVVFLLSRGYDEEYETLAYNILESLSIEEAGLTFDGMVMFIGYLDDEYNYADIDTDWLEDYLE